jgi:hypothetical protein
MGTLSADNIPAEDEYVKALSYVEGGEYTKGSLQDITRRIEKLQNKPITYPAQPSQQTTDTDLSIYKDLDGAIKKGEKAVDFATSTSTIIGVSIVGTLVGMAVVKSYLK